MWYGEDRDTQGDWYSLFLERAQGYGLNHLNFSRFVAPKTYHLLVGRGW